MDGLRILRPDEVIELAAEYTVGIEKAANIFLSLRGAILA